MMPRRAFIAGAVAVALPETRSVRFTTYPGACVEPQWVAGDLLRAEGFTDVQYIEVPEDFPSGQLLANGRADFSVEVAPVIPAHVAAGVPMIALADIHAGCFELFGHPPIRTIRDLRGKRVAVPARGDERHVFVSAMLGHVGLDLNRDVQWDFRPSDQGMRLFADRKVDAWLRIQRLIRVILETRWGADEWPIVKAELRNALKERSRLERAGWCN